MNPCTAIAGLAILYLVLFAVMYGLGMVEVGY